MSRRNYLTAIAVILIGGLVLTGSFGGTTGGLWPIYIEKGGNSAGINIALVTNYLPGSKHTGLDISLYTQQGNKSIINGVGLSIVRTTDPAIEDPGRATLNGVEICLVGVPPKEANEMQFTPLRKTINGLQVGLFLEQSNGAALQVGGYLINENGASVLVNTTIF